MHRLTYLAHVREAVTSAVSGVQDANCSLFWDDTRPNHLTKANLALLFEEAKRGAASFGVFVVNRHAPCGSRRHGEAYLLESISGETMSYGDPRFVWRYPLEQGISSRPCPSPCDDDGKRPHTVLVDVLVAVDADQSFCSGLCDILTDLHAAIDKAGDKKPRSGIREHLLRALLIINDHIRPEPLDDYIANQA